MRITERRAGAVERSETRLSRVGKKESRRTLYPAANDSLLATPMGFEPTISTVTGWHVNRYTTGPRAAERANARSRILWSLSLRMVM